MLALLAVWRLKPAVEVLKLVTALITVSGLGDIHQFEQPGKLMAYSVL